MPDSNLSLLYEINTAVYLNRLGRIVGHDITLNEVPDSEIEKLKNLGIKYVWLMGIWQRSEVSRQMTLHDESFLLSLRKTLPNFKEEDVIGSAYSIREYEVSESFGGKEALANFRDRLNSSGIKLILDFAPNHVGPDHSWVKDHPDYFIHGESKDLETEPDNYMDIDGQILARGRDPTFPAWSDVIQLNAFSDGYRQEAANLIDNFTDICDGIRCDMAMLLMNKIFADTWESRAGKIPEMEFWQQTISSAKAKRSDFIFIAEAYWDTEEELIKQGFDYCYDKELYDRLEQGVGEYVDHQLRRTDSYQASLMKFIENHDEIRVASIFSQQKTLAATAVILALPGMTLIHDGQLEGYKVKLPVHIQRAPIESVNDSFKEATIKMISTFINWHSDRPEITRLDTSDPSVLAWQFGNSNKLVVINYSGLRCEAVIHNKTGETSKLLLDPWQVILRS